MTPREEAANPLLDLSGPARYGAIAPEHVEPAIRAAIADAEAVRDRVLGQGGEPTWAGLVAPLDDAEERVERAWSAVSNLDATIGSEGIREAHRTAQALVTEHAARAGQDERLFRALERIARSADALDAAQRKILADDLRDFRLAGVALPPEAKARSRAIRAELASLGSSFADHVTDDTRDFRLVVEDPADVEGLPPTALAAARELARSDDPSAPEARWSFTHDHGSFGPFMAFQRNRALREHMMRTHSRRATQGARDNTPLIPKILSLRRELAGLLGFANYAELSLAPKMAPSPGEVRRFLHDLCARARPQALREYEELCALARTEDGLERVERHDLRYYAERVRRRRFGFSQEDLRPYFPLPKVVAGLGEVVRRLYGVELRDRTADGVVPTWHPDVRVLEATERGEVLGHVLFDPYARPGKRGGAWVSGSVSRKRRRDGSVQRPVAHLVCNFPSPVGGRPALLSHDDVRTLFHEAGHALHHLLTTVDYRAAAGIAGVPWDGVEFPSQFHENWIWDPESLAIVSGHVETGEPLPREKLDQVLGARKFLAGIDLLRQCELALVDLELHTGFDPSKDSVSELVADVRRRTGVVPEMEGDRFENAFLHVFSGGYAAGYYGYKWAEVLAADAFSRFEEEGIFSEAAARDFRRTVLAKGGSEDFLDIFRQFRGRAPAATALLRQSGIA